MAIAIEIADALARGLSSRPFSMRVPAARRYVPDYDRHELQELRVSVVPGPAETERVSRAQDLFAHTVTVVVAKATDGTNDQVDPLMQLCEEIIDAIRDGSLGSATMPADAQYYSSTFETLFDRDAMSDHRVFVGQIQVTYRVARQVGSA